MYESIEARLDSFKDWPSAHIKPESLAEAGFYFTGEIDRVRCFECRTEICCWEEGQSPLEEHIKWGGRCNFLKKKKKNQKLTDSTIKCKICFHEEVQIAILPCGHCTICISCSEKIIKCAICRGDISAKLRVYF